MRVITKLDMNYDNSVQDISNIMFSYNDSWQILFLKFPGMDSVCFTLKCVSYVIYDHAFNQLPQALSVSE